MKIVFLDSATLPMEFPRPAAAGEWVTRAQTAVEDVAVALRGAEVAITNKVRIPSNVIEQLPDLKFIAIAATGFDIIDFGACRRHGIVVSNVPGYSTQSVAESVIASIFALRRRLPAYARAGVNEWPDSSYFCIHAEPVQDVRGATLGIVGRGAIGSATALLAGAVGMQVRFAEHRGAESVRDGYTAFEEVLRGSDIISLHCPLNEDTRDLFGDDEIVAMRKGAMLINTARGGLVNETALISGLNSGHLGGAAIDVLEKEPPDSTNELLSCRHPNLIITPHVAWASRSSTNRLTEILLDNIAAYASGKAINVVGGNNC